SCWFGGDELGRSSIARGRVGGKCPSSVQAQGHSRGHHQGSEASFLLPEAGREAPGQASFGAKACPEKDSQRGGLSCNHWRRCLTAGVIMVNAVGKQIQRRQCQNMIPPPNATDARSRGSV